MFLKEKILSIRDRLLDPFSVDGLDREFEELLEIMMKSKPEDILDVKEDFEQVRELLCRNIEIISGSLKPLLNREQGGFFSRRV